MGNKTINTNIKYPFIFSIIFVLFFIPAHFLNKKIKNIDDTSYIAHAYTLGMDFDLDYSNEIARKFNKDGNMPSHFIGSGALAAPFVAVFGVIDRYSNHPVLQDRHSYFSSWSYFGFLFSISFYFLLGIIMLWSVIRKLFSSIGPDFYILTILSTGVIYYVLGRFTMSHGFEFFAGVGVIYFSHLLYLNGQNSKMNKGKIFYTLMIGFFVVLNLWLRPSNYNMLLTPFLFLLFVSILEKSRVNYKLFLLVLVSILIYLLPWFAFNDYYFHSIFPSSAQVYNTELSTRLGVPAQFSDKIMYILILSPNIFHILFSSEVGLLYSAPPILFGFIGFCVLVFYKQSFNKYFIILFLVLLLIYYGFLVALVLIWKTTASDYGYRYLFPLIPFSIVGFLYLVHFLNNNKFARLSRYVFVFILLFGVVNVLFYKASPNLFPQKKENVYGQMHGASLKDYEFHLLEEMLQPKTWVVVVGKGYMGLMTSKIVLENNTLLGFIPEAIKDKYLSRFEELPVSIYVQSTLLLLFWLLAGWIFTQRIKENA